MIDFPVQQIFGSFVENATIESVNCLGSGHINDTLLVKTLPADGPDYVLQRINHHIFKDVPRLMRNIELATVFIHKKLECIPGCDVSREVMQLVYCPDGKSFMKDNDGNYWRCYYYIKDTQSYDNVDSIAKAHEGGKIFGRFQALLSDMDAHQLTETIPQFHNLERRLQTFRKTVEKNPAGRVEEAFAQICFAEERATELLLLNDKIINGLIPLRITHNDTKFNNILFDNDGKALCVTDLDTVMPGSILHDFGDAIRTGASTADEDEADLHKMSLDINLFKAYAQGYLSETYTFLLPIEIENLALSARFMTFIIGLRFLTDYLDGDHYFKTSSPDHNLRRAKAQFKLLQTMEEQYGKMQEIITGIHESIKI